MSHADGGAALMARTSGGIGLRPLLLASLMLLANCAMPPPARRPAPGPGANVVPPRVLIDRALPGGITDREGWAADILDVFQRLSIDPTGEHICAVVAVIEQESSFRVDPVIPNLGQIAWREIDVRAEYAGIPRVVVHEVLQLKSSTGRSYADRIDTARTEKELSDIFEDFTGTLPLGRSLFASWNPIHTRGPMQVNVAFADRFVQFRPYPYAVKVSVDDEMFTRRGSIYFGVAHLLMYRAPYDRYLYRFADYNAGQYSSRNAAFQKAISIASGVRLVTDGALLPHASDVGSAGDTEAAIRGLAARLDLSESSIHAALEQGRTEEFENSALYRRVFSLAERVSGRRPPSALVPSIELQGPKIERKLTTDWYAHRVDGRFRQCLNQLAGA
jgi:hypothetical protein